VNRVIPGAAAGWCRAVTSGYDPGGRTTNKEFAMSTDMKNQFAPPKSAVADVSDRDGTGELAERGSRLGAVFLDGIITGFWMIPAYVVAFAALAKAPPTGAAGRFALFGALAATGWLFYVGLIGVFATWIYTAVLVHRNGQTIGKKIIGIKVVRSDGSRASLGRIFWMRNVLNSIIAFIPLVGGLYGLADSLWIFGDKRRCLHDYIADTIVIKA
jgi:uncharacterized RDD family membrane protein YckC